MGDLHHPRRPHHAHALAALSIAAITSSLALPFLGVIGGYELLTWPVGPITSSVVLGLVYIGTFASVGAYLSWSTGVGSIGVARASVSLNLLPVLTALIAVLVIGEDLRPAQLVGGPLVICGVTLAARGRRHAGDTQPVEKP